MRLTKRCMKCAASNASSASKKPWSLPQAVEECLVRIGQIPPNSNLCTKVSHWKHSQFSIPSDMFKFAALPKVVRASSEPTPPLQGGSFPAKRSSVRSGIVETQSQSTFKVSNKSSFPKTGSSVERENLSKFRSTPSISQGTKHWCTWKRSAMPKALCTVFRRPCGISLWPSWKRCGMNIGRPVQLYIII